VPFRSKAQQRWMFAAESRGELKPGTAHRWADHTKDMKSLPERAETEKKGFSMNFEQLAAKAAETTFVNNLAAATQISPQLIHQLAKMAAAPPIAFVKKAFDDPRGYVSFLKDATEVAMTKQAGRADIIQKLRGFLGGAYESARGRGEQMGGTFGRSNIAGKGSTAAETNVANAMDKSTGGALAGKGSTAAETNVANAMDKSTGGALAGGVPHVPGNAWDRTMGKGVLGGSRAGRNLQTGALGATGLTLANSVTGGGSEAPAGAPEALAPAPSPAKPTPGGVSTGAPTAPGAQSGGANPALKALLLGGGLGAGALGVRSLMNRKKPNKEKTAYDRLWDLARTKAVAAFRKEATDRVVRSLDRVAATVPHVKAASVRLIQSELLSGRTLGQAVATAYPTLAPEARGVLAYKIVSAACKTAESKGAPFRVTQRQEATVPVNGKNRHGKTLKSMSC
jgi:hypothetical protein